MTDEAHRHEREHDEDGGVREEDAHAEAVHEEAGEDGGHDLRRHRRGVVEAGVFSDVARRGELDYHRERVDVYRRPADAGEDEENVHEDGGSPALHEARAEERDGERRDAEEDRLFPADAGGDHADGLCVVSKTIIIKK